MGSCVSDKGRSAPRSADPSFENMGEFGCRSQQLYKTGKPKRAHWLFGGKPLTDEKLAHFCSRSIFYVAHHSICFCLSFLADRTDSVGKRCGALPFGYSSLKMRKIGEKVQTCTVKPSKNNLLRAQKKHNFLMCTPFCMLTAILATPHDVHFYANAQDMPFYAYRRWNDGWDALFYAYQCAENLKWNLPGTTSFFGRGLSGSIFGTC